MNKNNQNIDNKLIEIDNDRQNFLSEIFHSNKNLQLIDYLKEK